MDILPEHDWAQPKILIGAVIYASSRGVIGVTAKAVNRSRLVWTGNFPVVT